MTLLRLYRYSSNCHHGTIKMLSHLLCMHKLVYLHVKHGITVGLILQHISLNTPLPQKDLIEFEIYFLIGHPFLMSLVNKIILNNSDF